MVNFTSNTYQMKREILFFSNKISKDLSNPDRKFIADMNYGMLASGSCLLTDISDQLHEKIKKINTVDRLSRHLSKGTPNAALPLIFHRSKNGVLPIRSSTSTTAMWQNRTDITSKLLDGSGTVPAGLIKVPLITGLPF